MNNTKVLILLEELNEHRGLTHLVSEEAFRYPPSDQEDNLYVVGHDKHGNIHFLCVEDGENDEVTVRVVEDKTLFDNLIRYFQDNTRMPLCEKDENLRRSIGQNVSKLEISRT